MFGELAGVVVDVVDVVDADAKSDESIDVDVEGGTLKDTVEPEIDDALVLLGAA